MCETLRRAVGCTVASSGSIRLSPEYQSALKVHLESGWLQSTCSSPAAFLYLRPYLQQRHISAVLYLNTGGGVEFEGGELQFSTPDPNGGPSVIVPAPGRLAVYTAGDRNTHQVTPVIRRCSCSRESHGQAADGLLPDTTVGATSDGKLVQKSVMSNQGSCAASCTGTAGRCCGQRYSLSMWFTLDAGAQEDRGVRDWWIQWIQ